MTKSWKKFTAGNFLYIFLIKKCNLLIHRPPYRKPKLEEKPLALKRDHPALKNIKILFVWVIFALLDPDLAYQINTDPDPQLW
jgi:hypothetical protein